MRFALIGIDEDTAPIADVIYSSRDHALECIVAAESEPPLTERYPNVPIHNEWIDVLAHEVDYVIVSRGESPDRFENLRTLIEADVNAIISQPVSAALIDVYELEMLSQEYGSTLIPLFPICSNPGLLALDDLLHGSSGSTLGDVHSVNMERHGDPADESVIDRLFLHDVAALNFLFGEFREISAHASQGTTTSTLGIQLSRNGVLARWSTTLVGADEIAKLSINGSNGTAQLVLFAQGFELRVNGELLSSPESMREAESKSVNTHATALAFLDQLAKDEGKQSPAGQSHVGQGDAGQWRAAIMASEALHGLKRSLERGRTINIRVEEATEETNFKGTMTALGCGMLLFSVCSLAVVALSIHFVEVAGFPRLAGVLQMWPYLLLLSFILFLMAQLLMLISPKRTSSNRGTNSETK